MSDPHHSECPDCGKACERVIAVPIVSVRNADYRASKNAETRAENLKRAIGANGEMRQSTLKKYGQVSGHTHNCALNGCFGNSAQAEAQREDSAGEKSVGENSSAQTAHRFGGLPHLVGVDKK